MNKKSNNRLSLWLTALSLLVGAFAYGVVVGKYQVFPYAQLRAARMVAAYAAPTEHKDEVSAGRQVNYRNRVDIHRIYTVNTDVVMIGDSITDYAEWSELFPAVSISNRGIAGDTTKGLLQRLDSVTATGATMAFIMIGVNDIIGGQSADLIYSDYEKIVNKLLLNGVRPYIQSTLFVGERRKDKNAEIAALNSRLQDLAGKKNIEFIDLNTRLSKDGVLDDQYTSDSIHLNSAGYEVWKGLLDPLMDQHVKILQSRANSSRIQPLSNR